MAETTDFTLGSYFSMLVQTGGNELLETRFLFAAALLACIRILSTFEK